VFKKFFNKRKPLIWFDTNKYNWNVKCPKCKNVIDLNNCIRWEPITHPPTGIRIGCKCGNHFHIKNGIVIPDEFVEDGGEFKCAECGGYGRVFLKETTCGILCRTCNGEGIVDWIDNIRGDKHG